MVRKCRRSKFLGHLKLSIGDWTFFLFESTQDSVFGATSGPARTGLDYSDAFVAAFFLSALIMVIACSGFR